jgi:hypothetical protein
MRKDADSGYVLVTVAALLFVLVGFTALAIDMGTVLTSRTQLQRAADAAALAGAYTFVQTASATEAMALDRAKTVLKSNKDMGDALSDTSGVTYTVKCPSGCSGGTSTVYQVKVEISRTESTVFAAVLDVAGIADKVTAVAEAGTNSNGMSCIKPWFLPNTVADQDPTHTPCSASTAGNVLISNNAVTQYAKNNFGVPLQVKAQDPKNALQPSQFFEVEISATGGKAAYSDAISGCSNAQFMCQQSYNTLTGNSMGPTIQGVCSLITGDKNCNGASPDTYVGNGLFNWGDGTGIHDTSKALVYAPIVDLTAISGFCPTNQLPSTNTPVPVVGFAQIFIGGADKTADSITAYVLNVFACGASSGSDTSNTGTPVPLRLVRTQ